MRLAGCTIAPQAHLAQARVLIESFFAHEPNGHFYLLLVDGLPSNETLDPRVHLVAPSQLPTDEYTALCFEYNAGELCAALKAWFLFVLISVYGERQVVLLDPETLVLQPLDAMRQALAAANLVLTPNFIAPAPVQAGVTEDELLLRVGAFHSGVLGVRATDETTRCLAWWAERLRHGCHVDPARGLFLDQKWLDLAPALFDGVTVLRDPAYHVTWANLYGRNLTEENGQYRVNGQPLVCFRFSGLDPLDRQARGASGQSISLAADAPLRRLMDGYAARCMEQGYQRLQRLPYLYAALDNGVPIHSLLRSLYGGLDEATRRTFGNPFVTAPPGSFWRWATAMRVDLNGLTPFLVHLHRARPDVAAVYPHSQGEHRAAFAQWAQTHGVREHGYDPRLVALDHFESEE
ncbi:MAG: hypothetical protein KIT87_05485 [Anaerolineae bacterium]|nr:hypothetical protein [Anaerolineae bacterium]